MATLAQDLPVVAAPGQQLSVEQPNTVSQPVSPEQLDNSTYVHTAGSFRRGLRSGANMALATTNALAGQVGLDLGLSEFAADRFRAADEYVSKSEAIGQDVRDISQIKDFTSLVNFVTGAAGQGLASSAPAVGLALGLRRPVAGIMAGSFPQEAGEQVLKLRQDPNVASKDILPNSLVKGGVNSLLDATLGAERLVVNRVLDPKKAVGGVLKTTGKGIVQEGVTEGAQNIVGQSLHKAVNPAKEMDWHEVLNDAAAGAAGGGGLGLIGGVAGALPQAGLAASDAVGALRNRLSERKRPASDDTIPEDITADSTAEEIVDALKKQDDTRDSFVKDVWERVKAHTEAGKYKDLFSDPVAREAFEADIREAFDRSELRPKFDAALKQGQEWLDKGTAAVRAQAQKMYESSLKEEEAANKQPATTEQKLLPKPKDSLMRNRDEYFEMLGRDVLSGQPIINPARTKEVSDFLARHGYQEKSPGRWESTAKFSGMRGDPEVDTHKYMIENMDQDLRKGAKPDQLLGASKLIVALAREPGAARHGPFAHALTKMIGPKFEEILNFAIDQVHAEGPGRTFAKEAIGPVFKEKARGDKYRLKKIEEILNTFSQDVYQADPGFSKAVREQFAPRILSGLNNVPRQEGLGVTEKGGDFEAPRLQGFDQKLMADLKELTGEKFPVVRDLLDAIRHGEIPEVEEKTTRFNPETGEEEVVQEQAEWEERRADAELNMYKDPRLGKPFTVSSMEELRAAGEQATRIREEYGRKDVRVSPVKVNDEERDNYIEDEMEPQREELKARGMTDEDIDLYFASTDVYTFELDPADQKGLDQAALYRVHERFKKTGLKNGVVTIRKWRSVPTKKQRDGDAQMPKIDENAISIPNLVAEMIRTEHGNPRKSAYASAYVADMLARGLAALTNSDLFIGFKTEIPRDEAGNMVFPDEMKIVTLHGKDYFWKDIKTHKLTRKELRDVSDADIERHMKKIQAHEQKFQLQPSTNEELYRQAAADAEQESRDRAMGYTLKDPWEHTEVRTNSKGEPQEKRKIRVSDLNTEKEEFEAAEQVAARLRAQAEKIRSGKMDASARRRVAFLEKQATKIETSPEEAVPFRYMRTSPSMDRVEQVEQIEQNPGTLASQEREYDEETGRTYDEFDDPVVRQPEYRRASPRAVFEKPGEVVDVSPRGGVGGGAVNRPPKEGGSVARFMDSNRQGESREALLTQDQNTRSITPASGKVLGNVKPTSPDSRVTPPPVDPIRQKGKYESPATPDPKAKPRTAEDIERGRFAAEERFRKETGRPHGIKPGNANFTPMEEPQPGPDPLESPLLDKLTEVLEDWKNNKPTKYSLDSEDIRTVVKGLREDVGAKERGGLTLFDETTRDSVPGAGDVIGRTNWLGHQWWFRRPDPSVSAEHARRIIDKALEGKKLGAREQRFADYVTELAGRIVAGEEIDGPKGKFSAMNIDQGDPVRDAQEEQEIKDYLKKVLGNKIDVDDLFKEMKKAGSFANIGGVETFKIAIRALDKRSIAYHEALHALFERLMKSDPKAAYVLMRAAQSPTVLARLNQLLKDHPEAREQLKDPEEAAAYMYQFWASGEKGLLNVGPETKTWFEKVKGFLRKIAAIWADDMTAEMDAHDAGMILDAFHNGRFANPNTVAEVLADMGLTTRARAKVDKLWPSLGRFVDKAIWTAGGAVRDMGYGPLTKIMDQMLPSVDSEVKDPGFLQMKYVMANRFINRLVKTLEGMNKEQQRIVLDELRKGNRSYNRATQEIGDLLDDLHDYMVKSGVKTFERDEKGDILYVKGSSNSVPVYKDLRKIENYFPRVPDLEYLKAHKQEFIDLLTKHGVKNPEAKYSTFATDPNDARPPEEESFIGLTYFTPQTNERTLWMIPDEELAPFMNKDLFGTLSQYITRAARRSEYTSRFGNVGENIRAAKEAALQQGLTKDQAKTYDEAILAMEGSLSHDMSPKLKAIFGGITTYQNIRLLPLALFSSLVDPLGIAVRGGTIADASRAFFRGIRELVKNYDDEATELAKLVGSISAAGDMAVLSDMYGSQYMPKIQQKMNDAFFKYNGMESWNRSMRIAATKAAVAFIKKHAQGANEHSERYLRELGLTKDDVKLTVEAEVESRDGKKTKTWGIDVSDPKIQVAINRWVDQAILRPNASMRPIYMSDPMWMLVSHLKQYTYLFQQTILKRVYHEAKHGNYSPAFTLAGYVPMIIAADMARIALTPGSGDDDARANWDTSDWLWRGVQRAGFFGPGQMVLDAGADMAYGDIGIESIAGPSAQQFLDLIQAAARGHGVEKELLGAIPGYRLVR